MGFQRENGSGQALYLTQPTQFDLIISGTGNFLLTDGFSTVELYSSAIQSQIDSAVESFATVGSGNASVSLVAGNVGDSTATWRIVLSSPAGNPDMGVVTGSVATMWSDSVITTSSANAYRQAIVVTNDLVYLDSDGNKTLDSSNSTQSIFVNSGSQAVDLYIDCLLYTSPSPRDS